MKKLAYLIALVVMASCGMQEKNEQQRRNEDCKAIEDSAKVNTAGKTDIYLGFKFGMNDKEILRHIKKLEKEGKAERDYAGRCIVPMIGPHGTEYKAVLGVEYYDDKARKYTFKTDGSGDYIMIFSAFEEANKGVFSIYENEGIKGYYMQIDNILCKFMQVLGTSIVSFLDAPYIDLMEQEKDSIEKSRIDVYRM